MEGVRSSLVLKNPKALRIPLIGLFFYEVVLVSLFVFVYMTYNANTLKPPVADFPLYMLISWIPFALIPLHFFLLNTPVSVEEYTETYLVKTLMYSLTASKKVNYSDQAFFGSTVTLETNIGKVVLVLKKYCVKGGGISAKEFFDI